MLTGKERGYMETGKNHSEKYTGPAGKVWLAGGDIPAEMDKEIREFLKG